MNDTSRITMSKKNKTQLTGTVGNNTTNNRGGMETDYDEAEVEVEYSNLSNELKEYIIKISKDSISKINNTLNIFIFLYFLLYYNTVILF